MNRSWPLKNRVVWQQVFQPMLHFHHPQRLARGPPLGQHLFQIQTGSP